MHESRWWWHRTLAWIHEITKSFANAPPSIPKPPTALLLTQAHVGPWWKITLEDNALAILVVLALLALAVGTFLALVMIYMRLLELRMTAEYQRALMGAVQEGIQGASQGIQGALQGIQGASQGIRGASQGIHDVGIETAGAVRDMRSAWGNQNVMHDTLREARGVACDARRVVSSVSQMAADTSGIATGTRGILTDVHEMVKRVKESVGSAADLFDDVAETLADRYVMNDIMQDGEENDAPPQPATREPRSRRGAHHVFD
jgi:hypothetical protein